MPTQRVSQLEPRLGRGAAALAVDAPWTNPGKRHSYHWPELQCDHQAPMRTAQPWSK